MILVRSVRAITWLILTCMGLLVPQGAAAQSAVGAGPLTTSLVDSEPTVGTLSVGPVKFAPGVTIREVGWDDNVFDEPEEEQPKDDWVASFQPDVSAYTRLR